MKNLVLKFASLALVFGLYSCDALEKTDLVRAEPITVINGDTLVYEMHLTGLKKFRYDFNLKNGNKTIDVFETRFEDENGNEAMMEIEQTEQGLRINLDKPIADQTNTINGTTFELRGTK